MEEAVSALRRVVVLTPLRSEIPILYLGWVYQTSDNLDTQTAKFDIFHAGLDISLLQILTWTLDLPST